jgi:phage terminase Nu1 subunit (DNA packaging protein)
MAENQNLQPTKVIAKIFGVSTRRVEQLKTEGIIKGQGKPTKYDLLPTIQAYIKYLSDKANGREKREADAQLETDKLSAEKRIKTAKAEMAELELKEMRGELHKASDVEAITTGHVLYLRSMLMALPGKLAVDVAALDSAPECADRIKREVYFVLESLSNYRYDPDEYKKRVRERQGWDEQRGDEADDE